MLTEDDLRNMSKARLEEAEMLFEAGKYDTALYLCGYAVEFQIKARIISTLKWAAWPDKDPDVPKKFRTDNFQIHQLEHLLYLSGRWAQTKENKPFMASWSIVAKWDPALCRYRADGTVTKNEAESMIAASKIVTREI